MEPESLMAGINVQRMSRRALIKYSSAVATGVFLSAACGPAAPSAGTAAAPSTPAASQATAPANAALPPAQISFTHYRLTDPASGPALEASLKAFEQANPGVTIE